MKLIGALAAACALASPGTAQAEPVTFEHSSEAFIVHDALGTLAPDIYIGWGYDRYQSYPYIDEVSGSSQVPDPVSVPEPSSLALFGFGLVAIGLLTRVRARKRRKSSLASRRVPATKGNLHGVLAGACLLAVSGTAQAGPVAFEYEGTVSSMSGDTSGLSGTMLPGADMFLSYTFESTTPESASTISNPEYAFYSQEANTLFQSFSLTVGGIEFTMDVDRNGGGISIVLDELAGFDRYEAVTYLEPAFGYNTILGRLFLQDNSGAALVSLALPAIAPDPSDFGDLAFIELYGLGPTSPFTVRAASIQLAQTVAVPEPSSIALFGAGLATLIGLAAWRRQAQGVMQAACSPYGFGAAPSS